MEEITITIYPDGKKIHVPKGVNVLAGLIKNNIPIASNCGGKGICGKCRIKLIEGKLVTKETPPLPEEDIKNRIFLACQSEVNEDVTIELLPETLLPFRPSGYPSEDMEIPLPEELPFSPITKKYFLSLPKPDLNDTVSDFERICRELKKKEKRKKKYDISLQALTKLPVLLRKNDWEITVVIKDKEESDEIISVESRDTSTRNFGIAVDVGTTTVSAELIDLVNGKIIASGITLNRQAACGEDIISRIIYSEKEGGLEELHQQICTTVNDLIDDMTKRKGIDINDITGAVFSGNMTMIHLLLKITPSFLRKEPYIPVANFFPDVKPDEIGIKINPYGVISIVPGAYPYVGGDITSGVLATGMYKKSTVNILIDIGTNGEIVLGNKDWMICCAASAGPAFEGSGVKNGMRAISGAIEAIKIKRKGIEIKTIDNAHPLGICGSGYIDILGEFFSSGIINRAGVFISEDKRIREGEEGKEFVIVEKEDALNGEIVITQADIENLIRAKAAIFSALSLIIKKSGVKPSEIKNIFVAGGFGNCLNIRNAIKIGLLPELPIRKYRFMGNTSRTGARLYLLSSKARSLTEKIVSKMTYLELSRMPEYMEEYTKALFIPHTDLSLFPNSEKRRAY